MSGHNKWSKIKRKKAAGDAQKSRLFTKHATVIAMESRKAGGNLASPGLAAAIARAKADAMPKENIDRAVAKGKGGEGAALVAVLFETFGPGGTAILITAVTDNNNRTSQEIKHLLTKAGFQLGAPGSAAWAFTKNADGYTPTSATTLSESDGEALATLIEQLEDHPDIQDIFTTADDEPLCAS
jgi:transcriptional/translational regulatory protein YebC/TACO1